jgi:HrpA-like RNA helicase
MSTRNNKPNQNTTLTSINNTKKNTNRNTNITKNKNKNIPPPVKMNPMTGDLIPMEESSFNQKIGILDPEGINPNPLNNQPYSDNYRFLALNPDNPKGWTRLSAYKRAKEMIRKIENNQVVLAVYPTGVGKSVLIPKYVMHTLGYKGRVVITNPKTKPAVDGAGYAADCLDVAVGDEVGIKFRGSDEAWYNREKNKLLYCTDGYLVAKIMGTDPMLSDIDCVIIDEVHERKVQMDILMYLLLRVLKARPNFKVILISATINEKQFIDYYNKQSSWLRFTTDIAQSTETTFPIDVFYENQPVEKPSEKGIDKIWELLTTTDRGDILVFVNSYPEGLKMANSLNTYLQKNPLPKTKLFVSVLSSTTEKEEQKIITDLEAWKTQPGGPYNRKLIFGTNLVESSITFKGGLVYVIDNGRVLMAWYDPVRDIEHLDNFWISRASATQRMGRVGRTEKGFCYRLYTKKDFENMPEYTQTEISMKDLTMEMLGLLKQNDILTTNRLKEILNEFIEPPKEEYVDASLKKMESINAIRINPETKDGRITLLGKLLATAKVDSIYMAKALLRSYDYDCNRDLCNILGMLDALSGKMDDLFEKFNPRFMRDMDQNRYRQVIRNVKRDLASKHGDLLTLLNIYTKYNEMKMENPDKAYSWCKQRFIRPQLLDKAKNRSINNHKVLMDILRTVRRMKLGKQRFLERRREQQKRGNGNTTNKPANNTVTATVESIEEPATMTGGDIEMAEEGINKAEVIAEHYDMADDTVVFEEDLEYDEELHESNKNSMNGGARNYIQRFCDRFDEYCFEGGYDGLSTLTEEELMREINKMQNKNKKVKRGGANENSNMNNINVPSNNNRPANPNGSIEKVDGEMKKQNQDLLRELFGRSDIKSIRQEPVEVRITLSLLEGYQTNIGQNIGKKKYRNLFPVNITEAGISMSSVLNTMDKDPKFIIYHKLFSRDNKLSFENITSVSAELLNKYLPELSAEIAEIIKTRPVVISKNNKKKGKKDKKRKRNGQGKNKRQNQGKNSKNRIEELKRILEERRKKKEPNNKPPQNKPNNKKNSKPNNKKSKRNNE